MHMAKISLAGFKDPARRPRYIIWTGVSVMVLAAVMIVALGVTSTRWFCAEGCHKVQDDTIIGYERSAHANIGCMACHMPPNADPVTFILHKAEALAELYLTVTDNFHLPLNGDSHVSLAMGSDQCTQCHRLDNRNITPSAGIIIDHKAHADINTGCPTCHNRVAHREDFELTLTDPKTGEPNQPHADFMSMTACFRCHDLEENAAAPGACEACHPADFNLMPDNHRKDDFYPKGHASMAVEYKDKSDAAQPDAHDDEEEAKEQGFLGIERAYASAGPAKPKVRKEDVGMVIQAQRDHGPDEHVTLGEELPPVDSIFYCGTCHTGQFCYDCHGMEMPHPASFVQPEDPKHKEGHPQMSKGKEAAEKCVMCHGENEKTFFCDSCHHGSAINYEFDKKSSWTEKQHPKPIASSGIESCLDRCHTTKFCEDCHTQRKVYPSSHNAGDWTRPKAPGAVTKYGSEPAKVGAKHALDAQKSIKSCEVCHGSGGANSSFCRSCHVVEIPHAAEFKTNHVSSKKDPKPCQNCHQFTELCSNCHHVDSSTTQPWIQVHGGASNKNGATGCVEKCHTKDFCVKCHNDRKVIPASHKADKFTKDFSAKKAGHVDQFEKDAALCTYCHAGDPAKLTESKFCMDCHKMAMPHPIDGASDQKFRHANDDGGMVKGLNKGQCTNCHQQRFCDACHHEGSSDKDPWLKDHVRMVKKDGAQPCFDCHQPTYCSNCHVNLAKRGLLN
jgi:nitrate/TMAO reductase-like tetraheme cytochrome c subunit